MRILILLLFLALMPEYAFCQVPSICSADVSYGGFGSQLAYEEHVYGSGFTATSKVVVDGVVAPTLFVSSSHLRFGLPDSGVGSCGEMVVKNDAFQSNPMNITLWEGKGEGNEFRRPSSTDWYSWTLRFRAVLEPYTALGLDTVLRCMALQGSILTSDIDGTTRTQSLASTGIEINLKQHEVKSYQILNLVPCGWTKLLILDGNYACKPSTFFLPPDDRKKTPLLSGSSTLKTTNPTVTLKWKTTTGLEHLQISRDSAFSLSFIDTMLTTPELVINGLTPGSYYWRLRSISCSGEMSPWSATRTVMVIKKRPHIQTAELNEHSSTALLTGTFPLTTMTLVDGYACNIVTRTDTTLQVQLPGSGKGSAGWLTVRDDDAIGDSVLITGWTFEQSSHAPFSKNGQGSRDTTDRLFFRALLQDRLEADTTQDLFLNSTLASNTTIQAKSSDSAQPNVSVTIRDAMAKLSLNDREILVLDGSDTIMKAGLDIWLLPITTFKTRQKGSVKDAFPPREPLWMMAFPPDSLELHDPPAPWFLRYKCRTPLSDYQICRDTLSQAPPILTGVVSSGASTDGFTYFTLPNLPKTDSIFYFRGRSLVENRLHSVWSTWYAFRSPTSGKSVALLNPSEVSVRGIAGAIELTSAIGLQGRLTLFDLLGRVLLSQDVQLLQGSTLRIPFNASSGFCYFSLSTASGGTSGKVLVGK